MPALARNLFTLAFLLICCAVSAQTIPKNPNQLNGNLRQGKWTLLFDKDWNELTDASKAVYYRIIEYQQGKPTGTTRDYFVNGRLQWEGQLASENPDINSGLCIWYNTDGTKERESTFVNGKKEGKEILYHQGKKYAEGTYTDDQKNLDWIYYGMDYISYYSTGRQAFMVKEYAKAEAPFKKALDQSIKEFGASSIQYRDTRWWQYFVYEALNNIPQATTALKDAVRVSAILRDEYEIKVLEDAERYADKLKNDSKDESALPLYRIAARTREQRSWLQDYSYYKNLKAIMDIGYRMKKLDSIQYYFAKIATVLPPADRQLGTHLYDWSSFTIAQKQTDLFGKVEKACDDYLKIKEQKTEKDAGYAEAWMAFGQLQHAKGQYERALKSYADARAALAPEENQRLYLRALAFSVTTYNASKKYDATAKRVFDEFEQWNDRFAEHLGTDYLDNMADVAKYTSAIKDYAHSERVLLKILPVAEKQYGKTSSEYKMVAMTLSGVYEMQGKTELAKSVRPEFSNSDQKQIVQSMGIDNADADIKLLQKAVVAGRHADAVVIFERSYGILKSHYESNKDYDALITMNSSIAFSYQQIGDLYKAGQLLLSSKKLADEHLEKSSDTYINLLQTLGDYYMATGAYKEADETFYSGMQNLDKVKTEANAKANDAKYYQLATRLAGLFARQRYFRDAEKLYGDVLAYHARTDGKNSLLYQFNSTALADVYQQMGYFMLASDMYEEAMPILKKELGEQAPAYMDAYRTLANIYVLKGEYALAEPPLLKAKTFYKSALGARSERYVGVLTDLGMVYTFSGQWNKGAEIYHEEVAAHLEQVKNLFPLLSEKEKTSFYGLSRSKFNTYNVFAMKYLKSNPMEAGEMYNLQLVSKSLLFKATNRVRTSVVNSKDDNLKTLYSRWKDSREQLSKVYQLSDEQKKSAGVDEKVLERNINELERELTVKSELFARLISDNADWKAIRAALKPNEAAVEIVRIMEALPEYTFDFIGKGITIDSLDEEGYIRVNNLEVKGSATLSGLRIGETILSINGQSTKGKTLDQALDLIGASPAKLVVRKKNSKATYTVTIADDSVFYRSYPKKIRYVALVVTPDAQTPQYVIINNGDELETKYAKFYRNAIQHKIDDPYSYNAFWQPIKSILGSAKRIYFSPDGVYNTINPNTLYNPATDRYVLDDTELVLVSNTADILRPAVPSLSKRAVLVGFPDYNSGVTTTAARQPTEFVLLKKDSVQRFMNGNNISELPGTRVEVNAIESLLKPKLEVTKYMSADASEEKIKAMDAPKLLHIATHGFFLDDISATAGDERGVTGIASATLAANPLLRSGLLFAGAGKTIAEGRQNNQSEDGVLTAYEALNLNLNQTDMVVLSACETGLGQVQTGEGVYGLQRAFRAAGAQSVLMSLWKVDDQATQQLMTGFYSEWLSNGKKQAAFREAQLKLRKQYSHPYYWGAFVMMGQ